MIKEFIFVFFLLTIVSFICFFVDKDLDKKECMEYQKALNTPTKYVEINSVVRCFVQTKNGWIPLDSLRNGL